MFDTEVGVYVREVIHRQMESDDAEKEIPLTKLKCEVPLTASRALELGETVKRILFTAKDATTNPLIASVGLNLSALGVQTQRIEIRSAPDGKKALLVIEEAKIDDAVVTRVKKTGDWKLRFTISCSQESARQLEQLVQLYTTMRYFSFEEREPSLFSESSKAERKARRAAAEAEDADEAIGNAGDGAQATH